MKEYLFRAMPMFNRDCEKPLMPVPSWANTCWKIGRTLTTRTVMTIIIINIMMRG